MKSKEHLNLYHYTFVQAATGWAPAPAGLHVTLDNGETLAAEFVAADTLRLRISRQGRFPDRPSEAVCAAWRPEPGDFTVTPEHADGAAAPVAVVLANAALRLRVGLAPFLIEVRRADGSLLLASAADASGRSLAYGELNDAFALVRRCGPQDAFYGLGEKSGAFNRRGRRFTLWNTDVLNPTSSGSFTAHRTSDDPRSCNTGVEFDPFYVSIPFFYHHPAGEAAMAGFFVDNPHRGEFEFDEWDLYRVGFHGGAYDEYIFAGPAMPAILARYHALTGHMEPPPLWALGHHQCRWKNYDEAGVRRLAARYRESGIPCDTLWLDIDHMDGYRVFTWDRSRFPDPRGLIEELNDDGFRMITIVDPGVKFEPGAGNPVFEAGLRDDLFCRTAGGAPYVGQVWPGKTVFPDFSLPEARAWWGRLNAGHVRSGLAGIWNDMNEPATGDVPEGAMRFQRGAAPHERYHNEYALLMAMGTVEGLRAVMPELRTFVLSRAGSPGIQRYAANWMGDNLSRWDHLALGFPMGMGLSISGQPFVGADIGGFAGDTNAELLARWYQAAAFTPFFRNHNCSGHRDQYPWSFGPAYEALIAEAVRLRYRFLPYLYSAFIEAAETAAPVQRPLVYAYADDPATRDLNDQFLCGPDLLVAPVVQGGASARAVYFPRGEWLAYEDGHRVTGPALRTVAAPLERLPFFVRAGAVVPLWSEIPATTKGHHPESIELLLAVPEANGEWVSVLHEDDGLTFARREGACLRTRFTVRRAGGHLSLEIATEGRGYAEHRRKGFTLRLLGGESLDSDNVSVDGRRAALADLVLADGVRRVEFSTAAS
jgi:alpha-glucosidase